MRAREAHPTDARHGADGPQEVREVVLAVVVRVHRLSEQHHLAHPVRDDVAHFANDFAHATAALRPARVRHDAVRAAVVAAALHRDPCLHAVEAFGCEILVVLLKIEVGGHTDSRGQPAKNQALSEARANAVLSYLTGKFSTLQPSQYTAKGYGPTKPIAPNSSALNMAKNRRVEFVVINKEVLKRESQRRHLLQQGETPAPPTPAPADTTKK